MAEQHKQIFQAMGLPEATINEIENLTPEQMKDWKPDPVIQSVKGIYETNFLNDNDFLNKIPEDKVPETVKKKIESGQYTRFQKELMEAATKQLNLEDKDLAELTEEDRKSIKKTVVKIAEKYLGKKGNVHGLQDMQRQLTEVTDKLEKSNGEWEGKMNTQLEEANGKANAKLIKALVRADLASLDGLEYGVPVGYVADPVLASMMNKYTVTLGPNDELILKQKVNPQLDVLDKSNKPLTFQQALKETVIEMKLGKPKEENKDDKKKTTKTIQVGGEGSDATIELPNYISDKIAANSTE